MAVSETLQRKMDLFRANGRIFREDDELFAEESWIQVLLGQGVVPAGYDPSVDVTDESDIAGFLGGVEAVIAKCVAAMPPHADYVARVCPADR